jgi:hypothetical protein
MYPEFKRSLFPLLALAVTWVACSSPSPSEPAPIPCSYTVSPSSLSFDASGGSGSVTVTTSSSCSWTAASDKGWMSITGGSSSTGTGVVSVSLTPNTGPEARTGTLTIAGQAVAVTQHAAAAACTYEIDPQSAAFTKDSATGSFTVATAPGCAWTAAASVSWISVSAPSGSTSGAGAVSYSVARNTDLGARTGTISAGGRTFTIMQSGDTGLCEYQVSPVELSPCMPATQVSASVVTDAACSWTAASDVGWLSIAGGSSRTGPGTITVNVSENWDAPRTGVLMVRWPTPTAGQNVHVSQAGCRYAVSMPSIAVVAAGGAARFDVYQESDPNTCGGPLQNACVWTAQADVSWITVNTSMPQVGDNSVQLTILANTGTTARSGTVRVRDQVVRITQEGGPK